MVPCITGREERHVFRRAAEAEVEGRKETSWKTKEDSEMVWRKAREG